MNLWIRSQNRGTLMKVEILGQVDGVIMAYFPGGNVELGTYKEVERALEILSQIQKLLDTFEPQNMAKMIVYEMPQE